MMCYVCNVSACLYVELWSCFVVMFIVLYVYVCVHCWGPSMSVPATKTQRAVKSSTPACDFVACYKVQSSTLVWTGPQAECTCDGVYRMSTATAKTSLTSSSSAANTKVMESHCYLACSMLHAACTDVAVLSTVCRFQCISMSLCAQCSDCVVLWPQHVCEHLTDGCINANIFIICLQCFDSRKSI